jgi:hypothetical protein
MGRTIVLKTGTVSSRLGGFSLESFGVQFNPSMSRTRKATHRTRFRSGFCPGFLRRFLTFKDCIMNKTARFLSIATVAAFTAFGAQADEADGSQHALQFETNRTRAEVQAEAATVAQTRSLEPAGSRVTTYSSTADRAAVRAQTAEALRAGKIPFGEFSAM